MRYISNDDQRDQHGSKRKLDGGWKAAYDFLCYRLLAQDGIRVRVVSMPSWEIFAAQSAAYREAVLPRSVTARVSVEAGVTLGWERWIGAHGRAVGVDRFGSSAPAAVMLEQFGITAENVVRVTRDVLGL